MGGGGHGGRGHGDNGDRAFFCGVALTPGGWQAGFLILSRLFLVFPPGGIVDGSFGSQRKLL